MRVFHWALVCCVILNQFLLEGGEAPHRWTGYAALVLIAGRLVWGFVGSAHARFASFAPTPERVREHVRGLLRGRVPNYVGHSPLGALMMLALVSLVIALGATGWLQTTDAFWGDESLQDAHETLANVLLMTAGMHAIAAIVIGRLERVRLVKAMVTGVKQSY